jgi:hypothetical protein
MGLAMRRKQAITSITGRKAFRETPFFSPSLAAGGLLGSWWRFD